MPSKLDFNSTKEFRDKILSRTLPVQNGPLSQTADSYRINTLTDFPNIDQPPVDANRTEDLTNISKVNLYKPNEYFIREELNTLPRRANLSLYPYFTSSKHTYVGILTTDTFDTESELMKFAAWNIKENPEGPFFSRVQQNLETATVGRVRLIDALEGNIATATNIVTGKEPLIESNNKITVAKTATGKGIDFLQTVTGVEFPWSEIPGDYLSNPENPINNRPLANTQVGAILQDVTGALGSLIGVQRRPTLERKPSDLFIEYMGSGQRQVLYDNLSYSKYGPNYTTTARSQQSSKVFNFVDSIAQNINKFFGADAPDMDAYIGDDRGNDVKYAMGDFNDRPVRSPFYLSLLFDPVQTRLFQRQKNLSEGGSIGGTLTWISSKSKNKLGANNQEWGNQKGGFEDSKSTNYSYREDSILGYTQEILETLPTNGSEMRSHVANVIDQTSRIFKDGDTLLSRGSAVKYVDKFGQETGVEYCRAWTKDRTYLNYSDTMKRTANIRKFDGSVLGGGSRPWNFNIAPMSNGNGSFDGSTNIFRQGKDFYAKKYMFSIENLAWKTSNIPGYTYNDLPYCERGNNGGRVMWFPPYDLKIQETNSAKWDANSFLGRPEPIYTYQNTERTGSISFKVIVDHPSVLNLLVREHFKGMSDEESDNYINAFFAGCEEVDFYDLIQRYSTITPDDAKLILEYLEGGNDKDTIERKKYLLKRIEQNQPPITQPTGNVNTTSTPENISLEVSLKFLNDEPEKNGDKKSIVSPSTYKSYLDRITRSGFKEEQITLLNNVVTNLVKGIYPPNYTSKDRNNDLRTLFGYDGITEAQIPDLMTKQSASLAAIIDGASSGYTKFVSSIQQLQEDIKNDVVQEMTIHLLSSTSAIADNDYNFYLSIRRSHSILQEILDKLCINGVKPENKWSYNGNSDIDIEYEFKELGFTDKTGKLKITTKNEGEGYTISENTICGSKNFVEVELRKVAPVAFNCRQTQVNFVYTKKNQTVQNIPSEPKTSGNQSTPLFQIVPDTNVTLGVDSVIARRRPPIDAMKQIIMKTLSECYYFKKLEETDPLVFGSLKDKFKYFHPGFHSTTPEGLNSRLTFLLQCTRPGDTIPIKGVDSSLDFRARNTSFGPPPICVLRIGDFYHSKIVIKDVNISYEDTTWDMNPEGIGIQPMIANVTLQVFFIGGQGLEKPVNMLQNALSSNFFANTEMYDPRSIGTNQTIGGKKQEDFTKEFLDKLTDNTGKKPEYVEPDTSETTSTGVYFGELISSTTLNYNVLVDDIFRKTESYITGYPSLYNNVVTKYGENISSILLSPNYRKIKEYDVAQNPLTNTTINLFGLYETGRDILILTNILEHKLLGTLTGGSLNVLEMFGFDKVIPTNLTAKATIYLRDYLSSFIQNTIDELKSDVNVKGIEDLRNNLIISLDKANFVVHYEYDAKLEENKTEATKAELIDFVLYSGYSSCIDYINKNSSIFYNDLDTSIDFNNAVQALTNAEFKTIMSELLYPTNSTTFVSSVFGKDKNFDAKLTEKLKKKYESFVSETKEKKFKFSKFIQNDNANRSFEIVQPQVKITDQAVIDEIIKLNNRPNSVVNKLNYYRV